MSQPISSQAIPSIPNQVGQIADIAKGSANLHMGEVISAKSGIITVQVLGGSIVEASYIRNVRQPMAGDLVALITAGASWIVMGAIAQGPTDNMVVNSTFDEGDFGSPPPNWDSYTVPGSTGAVILQKYNNFVGAQVAGDACCLVRSTSGTFLNHVLSSRPIGVNVGEVWSGRALVSAYANYPFAVTNVGVGVGLSFYALPTDTYPNVVSATSFVGFAIPPLVPLWFPVAAYGSAGNYEGVTIPPGVNYIRLSLFTNHDSQAQAFYQGSVMWTQGVVRKLS